MPKILKYHNGKKNPKISTYLKKINIYQTS